MIKINIFNINGLYNSVIPSPVTTLSIISGKILWNIIIYTNKLNNNE